MRFGCNSSYELKIHKFSCNSFIKWKSEDFYLDELIFTVNSKTFEPTEESFAKKFERNAPLEGRTTDSALYWKNIAAQLYEKLEEKK